MDGHPRQKDWIVTVLILTLKGELLKKVLRFLRTRPFHMVGGSSVEELN